MKKQYFADKKDYVKYGIIRYLLKQGLTCMVCCMMTPNDDTRQGDDKDYLCDPNHYRHYDAAIFDYLKHQVCGGSPDIRSIERLSPIRRCLFYWRSFPQSSGRVTRDEHYGRRKNYFQGCLHRAKGTDLVLIDPDIGPERDGIDRRNLNKYVRWNEITRIYNAGHSVIVFNDVQTPAGALEANRVATLRVGLLQDNLPDAQVTVLRTPALAFYFAAHDRHRRAMQRARAAILRRWGNYVW